MYYNLSQTNYIALFYTELHKVALR